ncbi:2-oxoglutarate-Fe(II) type oxidoreductase hxnY-like [Mercurialis annua]|uniref:2-oxoglutarate-Fe(II) type oxidoreductase hxnY-like n=1 Tax=Mercurialis annua TaxID=3986 RepID=UPI00215EFAEC|nr:2-oxoglutarate-Fe(II) type oxidoreductase hxnY-like [Mercurialis annua]
MEVSINTCTHRLANHVIFVLLHPETTHHISPQLTMTVTAQLPIVDLSSPDHLSLANSIRRACEEYGFFYLINHGIEKGFIAEVFEESKKLFSLPLNEKMKLFRQNYRGYVPLYSQNFDFASRNSKGSANESFSIGPLENSENRWPSEEVPPSWKPTMEAYHTNLLSTGKRVLSLMALALKLDKDYFDKIGAPQGTLRLLHYPGEVERSEEEILSVAAHSDFGMITLLMTEGVPGLQVCRDKFKETPTWENVLHMDGAFIVNIGDLMERWTNCSFRSTLHRVIPAGQKRYSMAYFVNPNPDCIVQCLESCYSESCPRRFPPIRSGDYIKELLRLTYDS